MALFSFGARFSEKVSLSTTMKRYGADENEIDALSVDSVEIELATSDCELESQAESEFDDKSATSYLSMLSNLLWSGVVERKPSYVFGLDSWVPNDLETIVEVPEGLLERYKKVYPLMGDDLEKNGSFSVITEAHPEVFPGDQSESSYSSRSQSPIGELRSRSASPLVSGSPPPEESLFPSTSARKPPLHHLVITFWKGSRNNKHTLSLYRSRRVTDAIALCERCRECRELFRLNPKQMEKVVYIGGLIEALRKHLLWKSVHIAASLGIMEYFKPANKYNKAAIRLACQPEGMTPLMIAIQNSRADLVSLLLSMGVDVTMVDTNKNNVLHLAAAASADIVTILMESGKCAELLNAPNIDGSSPLYLAVTGANAYCAKAFRNYGASFTAIHPAASNKPLLEAMKKNRMDVALIKSILDADPNALEEKDPVTGNGVLHSAMYKKPLLALLQLKAKELHLDARNYQMQTPLHLYVQRNDLALVMAFAAYNADLNAKDNNGNTPLHLAVSNLNLDIARLLLCLGAEPNIVNNHLETPRHLAAKQKDNETAREIVRDLVICGAKSCSAGFAGCTVACVHRDNFVGEPKGSSASLNQAANGQSAEGESRVSVHPQAATAPYEFELDPDSHQLDPAYKDPSPLRDFPQQGAIKRILEKLRQFAATKEESNVVSVLSLDGGGIKGLVIVQTLLALQKYLDQPLLNYFDWVAGTSTGAYVAGAFTTGKTLRLMQRIYLRFKDAIFDTWSRPYSADILETFLQEMFGAETKLSDVKYPRMFFTTVRADTFPVQLELLRNYRLPIDEEQNKEMGFGDPSEILLWRAARRSSAAPTYFPSSEGKYIDGGMVSNNPTLDLMSEISFWNSVCQFQCPEDLQDVQVGCVVSIGTGVTPVSPVDPSLFEMSDMFGMLRGLRNLSLMVLDQATATEGAPISRSRSWCHSLGIPYFRLNAPLFKDIMLDSKEDADLVKMMWDVVVYTHTHRKDFEDLATLLKAIGTNRNRKKRALSLMKPSTAT